MTSGPQLLRSLTFKAVKGIPYKVEDLVDDTIVTHLINQYCMHVSALISRAVKLLSCLVLGTVFGKF